MTRLTKIYLAALLLLLVGFAGLLTDGTGSVRSKDAGGLALVGTMPGPALAVPYFEARWRLLNDDSGALFPGMRPLSTMDFVYAR